MREFWQKLKRKTDFLVRKDPFGYSIDKKPHFPVQGWFERLVSRISIPEDQQRVIEDLAGRGTIIYAIKYRSQFDFVYISLRLYQLGLPAASFVFDLHPYLWQPRWYAMKILGYHLYHFIRRGSLPNPYEDGYYRKKVQEGLTGLMFLLGKKGYYRRTVLVGNDPLEHLVEIQKETERPIFVVPLMLLYTRHPGRPRRGAMELFSDRGSSRGLSESFCPSCAGTRTPFSRSGRR